MEKGEEVKRKQRRKKGKILEIKYVNQLEDEGDKKNEKATRISVREG